MTLTSFSSKIDRYLVHWSVGGATWEPAETIEKDAPEEVGRFLARRNERLTPSLLRNLPLEVRRKIEEIGYADD